MALNDRTKIVDVSIESEMKTSYIDYSMSVIVSRALPDVRDGLKPSQRRILVAMNDLNLAPGRGYRKCAKIAGDTSGNYHPHGEQVVYPTLVRMAQDWVMRYPLVDGQGNYGSIDGDAPAAMRYCVAGDTLVATPSGTVRIDAIVPGAAEDSDHDVALELYDRDGRVVSASKLFHSGSHPTRRLRTVEGYELIGTGNHPLLCLEHVDGAPSMTWKLLDAIAPGDRVVLSRQPRNADQILGDRDRQTAILLGAFLSEGWISPERAGFNNIDRNYFDLVVAAYDAVVGGKRYVYSRTIASGSLLFELDIHNLEHLRQSPLAAVHGRSHEKVVPESVWRGSGAFKRAFLQSLFMGDGSSSLLPRHTIQISYSTRSEELARGVQTLLLEFGVVSRICRYENGEFKVVITNRRDGRQFARAVGFLGWKQEKLEADLATIPVASRALSHDHVPFLAGYVRSHARSGKNREWLTKHNVDRIERWEQGGTAILERIEQDEVRVVAERLANADYYYAEVESVVDAGVRPVYSLRVDTDEHAFITNGFISHNTEARLTALAADILADLDKNTVDFRPNYDETREEPMVLPGVVPNLLINGCSGIAVGMATEVPPHNLTEVCDAIIHIIEQPEATIADLMKIVKGPDFPTGGIIYGTQGIRDCHTNGRGLIKVRARVQVEEGRQGRMSLVATEIPFQVNKAALLEKIADLVKEAKVQGISDLRDESDRDGMRIVIELKKDANPKVVLNQLFVHSPLQTTFGAIMLALVDQRPQVLTLRGLLDQYVIHRQIVVRRRTEFDLAEAERRAHILEGLKIALDHLDAVITLIRASKDVETARTGLMTEFKLSEIQANAILEMRLSRLTGLERKKVEEEYLEVIQLIEKLKSILASPKKILGIIKDEVTRLKEKHGDARRTEIVAEEGDIQYEDTIEQKDMVITISHAGYVKRQEISSYRSQRRGGKGVIGARTKEEDYIEHLFVAGTHSYLLFLTHLGRCYWLKVHEIEQAGRMARGRPLVNHLEGLARDERVQAVVAVKEFDDQHYLVCATKKGLIKKTVLSAYGNPRRGGINAILLEDGDALIEAMISDGTQDFILAKKKGLAVRFHENEVRSMGRTSYGVKAVTLDDDTDEVVSMVGVQRQDSILTVTENGYGKRSEISEYRVSHRGGKGIITIKTTERNGNVVAVKEVVDGDELMIITRSGQMIKMPVKGISVIGRNTQGVRLVNLAPAGEGDLLPDAVAAVTRVVGEEDAGAVVNGGNGEAELGDEVPGGETSN
ncbi:MAG TPA: DNA gyrase subunit A [Candidatus Eisenbacteria bacterium]|nr:DNA gyrase subunit A [Candidatus Eisenbacteria bacterium]